MKNRPVIDRCPTCHQIIRKQRSTGHRSQNARFYGHCRSIAEQLSDAKMQYVTSEVAAAIKRMAVEDGYYTKMSPDGIEVPISESEADSVQENILIRRAQMFADAHGFWLIEYINRVPTKVRAADLKIAPEESEK